MTFQNDADRHHFVNRVRSYIDGGTKVTVEDILEAIDRHEDPDDICSRILVSAQRGVHT